MATNIWKLRNFLLTASFFLGLLSVVSAQNSGYFIDDEGGQPRFIQRLAWSGGEYAARYEVVIERDYGGTYRNHSREFTTELYINTSLQPGRYRFRVIPRDILGRPGQASEWKYIEVLPALKPEISDALPEYVTDTEDESSGFVFNITGNNLDPNAEIFIRRADGTQIIPEARDSGDGNISVFVDSGALVPGEYGIVVRNPGGLEANIGGIVLSIPEPEPELAAVPEEEPVREITPDLLNPVLFGMGVAWMPSFPAYGENIESGFSAFGFKGYVNVLFSIAATVYIGPELSALYYRINSPDNDSGMFMAFDLHLIVRKWFSGQKAAASFRIGANFGKSLDELNVKTGASLLWRFSKNLLLEGGLDYSHQFLEVPSGFFCPWLGITCQF